MTRSGNYLTRLAAVAAKHFLRAQKVPANVQKAMGRKHHKAQTQGKGGSRCKGYRPPARAGVNGSLDMTRVYAELDAAATRKHTTINRSN